MNRRFAVFLKPFRLGFALPALVVSALTACAKPATPEECKAATIHMMEVQLDSPDFAAAASLGAGMPPEFVQESREFLKSRVPSLITPAFVEQCVERMARKDVQCTLTATTTDELIGKCHWKVVQGPKGAALGF